MTPEELSRQLAPIATQLRRICGSSTGDGFPPAMQQLAPLAAEITASIAAVLNTVQDPLGTGQHNLRALRALGHRLTAAADDALSELTRSLSGEDGS